MLHSTDVDLRITAGESLALVLEFAYDYDSQYEPNDLNGLIVAVWSLDFFCKCMVFFPSFPSSFFYLALISGETAGNRLQQVSEQEGQEGAEEQLQGCVEGGRGG